MIPPSGTFDYLVIVPEARSARSEGGFECRAETRCPVVRTGSNLEDSRLVGISPQVRVTDAGPPSETGLRPPWSLRKRSRITLVATAQDQASVGEASVATRCTCCEMADAVSVSRLSGAGSWWPLPARL
jgi:hypothetical protein